MSTTAADSPEVEQLKARTLTLCEENACLAGEIAELRGRLAERAVIGPYDQPADVLAVLDILRSLSEAAQASVSAGRAAACPRRATR